MDMIRKINDRRADRQTDRIALRRHNNDILRRNIILDRCNKLLRIVARLLCFQHLTNPRNARIHDRIAFDPLLVFPVRCDTVFRICMHFPCTNLHFKRNALLAEHGGMQRLIAVRLGIRNIILKAVRNRTEHIMNQTEHAVALVDRRHNHAHRIFIVNLINGFVVDIHLFIDAVDTLDAPVDLRRCHKVQ